MAPHWAVALLALAVVTLPAERVVAGNIPSAALEEPVPTQAVGTRAFQTVRTQLGEKGLSRGQATRAVSGLTSDELTEVAQHPRQIQVVGALAWYWLSLIATAIGMLTNWLFGKSR